MDLCEFQTSQSYIVRFCLKSKNNRNYLSTHKNFSTQTYFHVIEEKNFYILFYQINISLQIFIFFLNQTLRTGKGSLSETQKREKIAKYMLGIKLSGKALA